MSIPRLASSRMKLNITELSERAATVDFKDAVLDALRDFIDTTVVLGSDVLVASYIKPRKTAGGIIIPEKSIEEDRYQSKVGLVLKLGEEAFKYQGQYAYAGTVPKTGNYVVYHTSDSREIGVHSFSCRVIDSSLIRMIVVDPDVVY